ncbi:uncharacterized protein PGTG_16289 [Puccinia graminis f. sp. tritici CRL 75-36-700-3]|uniref:Uncharacterized protein n=1 Tax=Puccinia graminis f. sp. tritici (strain CRL 75-36-700-3 / race SCCL) TaxID=418459 RepID=E3L168_PUCGT|nr:uncharacterized protein PGTG_16289 [Puccinia graminis f. sp. tritici CRL 75-36-700-3]EFP90263.2 hypothetical protein PGTG_16289 [Puccinia graminis f. sp. tritici CRL 75-36-700-3]
MELTLGGGMSFELAFARYGLFWGVNFAFNQSDRAKPPNNINHSKTDTRSTSPSADPERPKVGNITINDSLKLEACIYVLLRKHFHNHPAYLTILELPPPTRNSVNSHHLILVYKTSFYSFYLPVSLALSLHGITSPSDRGSTGNSTIDLYRQAMDIFLPLGKYFQAQDDCWDCCGDSKAVRGSETSSIINALGMSTSL